MARLDGKFIKGIVGPTVYKQYRNKQVLQKVPRYVAANHTEASKKTAATFGIASNLAASLRDNLQPVITDHVEGEMVNRLNSEVIHILNQSIDPQTGGFSFVNDSFSRLNGFEFNEKSMVRNNFSAQPVLQVTNNQLQINIPEMQLPLEFKYPKGIGLCLLSFGLGLYDLTNGYSYFSPVQSKEIEYKYEPVNIPPHQFDFEIQPGCLCIAVISLQFLRKTFAGNMFYNTIDFNPVAILKAFIADGVATDKKILQVGTK